MDALLENILGDISILCVLLIIFTVRKNSWFIADPFNMISGDVLIHATWEIFSDLLHFSFQLKPFENVTCVFEEYIAVINRWFSWVFIALKFVENLIRHNFISFPLAERIIVLFRSVFDVIYVWIQLWEAFTR